MPALPNAHARIGQSQRVRLRQHAIKRSMQRIVLRDIRPHTLAGSGVVAQQRLKAFTLLRRYRTVDKRVNVVFFNRRFHHFTRRRVDGPLAIDPCAPFSSSNWRSRSRPLESRDMTVPIGTSSANPASAYDSCSSPTRRMTSR